MIDITVDTQQFVRSMTELERNQVPFATYRAINDTARGAQQAVRSRMDRVLTISPRRETFMKRMVKIDPMDRATKHRLETVIQIIGPNAKPSRGTILARHEEGGTHLRLQRDKPFFIPTRNIRPGDRDEVPRNLYPSALRLTQRRQVTTLLAPRVKRTKRGVVQWKGKRRTFILDPHEHYGVGDWAIYQRIGSKRGDIRKLWHLRERITLPPRLGFYTEVQTYVRANWARHFAENFAYALRTAR